MELIPLLLATLFVAPPAPLGPEPEPGLSRDAFGDPLPFGAVARYGTLRYRAGFAGGVAFGRDGKTLISAGAGDQLHFWEAATGKLVRQYEAFSTYNHKFALSPDGKQVATGNWNDRELKLRDLETGKVVRRLRGLSEPPGPLCFSPDGKLLAACEINSGSALVWDATSGKVVTRLRMNPDPRQVAYTIAFSQDGKYVALCDRDVMVFEAATWKHVSVLRGHTDHICTVAFSPDNSRVVTAAFDGTLRLWDRAARKEVRRIADDIHPYVAVTRDGKTAIGNDKEHRLTAWSVETGKKVYRSTTRVPAGGFTLSDDETRVAGWNFSAVLVYDARTGNCLTPLPVPDHPFGMIAFSPNGKFLALAYGVSNRLDVRLWGFQSGLVIDQPRVNITNPWAVRVSESREVIVFGSAPGRGVEIWNLTAKKRTAVLPHENYSNSAVFAKGGRVYLASKEWAEWDTPANRIERRVSLPQDQMHPQLLLSADERVLLTCRDSSAVMWSARTGKQLSTMALRRNEYALAISPDGQQFMTGGPDKARLRDSRSGALVIDFGGKDIQAAALSPDGRLIAVPDGPGVFQLWDTKTRRKLRRLQGHRDNLRHLFSPNSRWLASVSTDTTVLVWDVRRIAPGGK